jgi:hypothetical protein
MKLRLACIAVLSILIVYGLGTGLLYSLNLNLDSDMVVPGIVAKEMFSHGNLQYNFPVNDPYLFTDIYTFHLIPQVLSGYDPTVLRLTAYVMFLIAILVFAFIVYRYAGLVSALLFAALMANLNPAAYPYFINPVWHVGTLIAVGVFIIIFDFDRIRKASIYRILVYTVAVALILLSDSILLALFIVPYIACYLLFYRPEIVKSMPSGKKADKRAHGAQPAEKKKELKRVDETVAILTLMSAAAWLFKTFEPVSIGKWLPYFNDTAVSLASIQQAFTVNLPLFFQCLALLVNQGLYNLLSMHIGILDVVVTVVFLGALYLAITRANKQARYLYLIFLFSSVTMFLGFVFSNLADGLMSSRYLIFTAVSIFMVIALAYDEKDEKYDLNALLFVLALVLIVSTVSSNLSILTSLDGHPNQEQYGLIDYLKSHNDTVGFSDYGNANLITYLSNEQVTTRAARFTDSGGLEQFPWLGSDKWYDVPPSTYFVLAKNDSVFYGDLQNSIKKFQPKGVQSYDNYTIYRY